MYDKRAIMKRAHDLRREARGDFAFCLRQAWAEARHRDVMVQPTLILPPVIQVAASAIDLVRKIRRSRVEVAGRIQIDFGVRVTPRDEAPMAYVLSKQGAAGMDYDGRI